MTDDVIEQAARVIYEHGDDVYEYEDDGMPRCQCGEGIDGSNLSTDGASHIARALDDAGLLRQEPPTRDEIARVIRQATDDGASRTEDYADAALALLEGRKR